MLLGIALLYALGGMAQGSYQWGILPSVNLNKSLEAGWRINTKLESRQAFGAGTFRQMDSRGYEYVLTDWAVLGGKKIGNQSIFAGGMIRRRNGQWVQRLIQQYALVQRFSGAKLAHRLATDQTFEATEPVTVRLRYRIGTELPLRGRKVDPREPYFKLNHEYLNQWQGEDYELEIRLVPVVGMLITDANKLEMGLDYRLDRFLAGPARQRCWLSLNWYVSW